MPEHAEGPFEVTLTPLPAPGSEASGLGRMALDKRYRGDLEAASVGEMLTAMTATSGSAGYVAVERVTGALHGRSGGFALQHCGIIDRGAPTLSITVVPDSGTGELTGLTGRMTIAVDGGKHRYAFDYTMPGS